MAKKRLIYQLYPSYLAISLLAIVAVIVFSYYSFRTIYFEHVTNDLKDKANIIAVQVNDLVSQQQHERLQQVCDQIGNKAHTRLTIISPSGHVLAESHRDLPLESHADRPEFIAAMQTGFATSIRFSDTMGQKMMYGAITIDRDGTPLAVIRTAMPITAIGKVLNNMYIELIIAALAVAACVAAVSLAFSRRIAKPIVQMTKTAQAFAKGDLARRIPMPRIRETAALARSLNKMARQLDERMQNLTTQKNQVQAILSGMTEGVIAVDAEARIMTINQAAAELLGTETRHATGRNIQEVLRNIDIQKFIEQTLASAEPTETELSLPIDEVKYCRLRGVSLAHNNPPQAAAVIVISDMTRIRKLENIRRDFVANVSHELKTPITSIKGFVETLLHGAVEDPDQARRFLDIIIRHTDRLNAIIEDLLSLSRLEEDKKKKQLVFETSPLRPILQNAAQAPNSKAQQKNMQITIECPETLTAKANPHLLEQAITNLVSNAVKYSDPSSDIKIQAHRVNNHVAIEVTDQGCGIEQHHLSRIFERFYVVDKGRSRKLGGTGLGLAIVKHIAQAHGGYVTVESTPGKGSNFTIHLPAQ